MCIRDSSWGPSPPYVERGLAGRRHTPARQSVISTKQHPHRCETERGSLSDLCRWLLGSIPAVCHARPGREDDTLLPGSLSSVQTSIHTDVRLRGDRFPTSVDGSWGRSPLYVNRSLAGRRLTPARQSVISTKKHTYRCKTCLLYTSPSPRDLSTSRMPSSA